MPPSEEYPNRLGHKIVTRPEGIVMEVIAKIIDKDVYLMIDYFEGDKENSTGAYFLTAAQLEDVIRGYETNNWEYEL